MGVRHIVSSIFLVASFFVPVRSDNSKPGGYFETPPPAGADQDYSQNKVYYIGEEIQLQWVMDSGPIGLLLWQQGNRTQSSSIFSNVTSPNNSYPWTVELAYADVTFNLTPTLDTPGNVFFFQIYVAGNSYPELGSHYFNISKTAPSSATSIAMQTSSSQTTSPQTISPTNPAATASSATPVNSASTLSSGQEAGIGVGVGLVGLLTIAALVWFLRFRRPKHSLPAQEMHAYPTMDPLSDNKNGKSHQNHHVSGLTGERRFEMPGYHQSQELAAANQSQELP